MLLDQKKRRIPVIGARMIKSALAVFVCYLLYILRGYRGIPFYSSIAAIECIQPYRHISHQVAINRIFATLNGEFVGRIILFV